MGHSPFSSSMFRVIVVEELTRTRDAASAWPFRMDRTSRTNRQSGRESQRLQDLPMMMVQPSILQVIFWYVDEGV